MYLFIYFLSIILCHIDQLEPFRKMYLTIGSEKKKLCFFYGITVFILIAVAVLRSENVGNDSAMNKYIFFNIFKGNIPSYEKGYIFFIKIIQIFTQRFDYFLIICSFLTLFIIFFIYKQFNNYEITLPLFIAVNYVATFSILRNYISMACLLAAFYYIEKKNHVIGAILFSIIALSFHRSALIFILLYIFCRYFYNACTVLILIITGILTNLPFIQYIIADILHSISGRYLGYMQSQGKISTVYVTILLTVSIISYYYRNKILGNSTYLVLHRANVCMFIFSFLLPWFPNYSRVISSFLLFEGIFFGYIASCIKNKFNLLFYKVLIYTGFTGFMILNITGTYLFRF